MSRTLFAICLIVIGLAILLLLSALPAQAQSGAPEDDDNCVACHEHQYYLYDSGKWFCLCDAPMHCVYCHGGRTDTPVKELAHIGLVLHPTREHAQRCQACHSQDYMQRVVTFTTIAGVNSTPQVIVTATPAEPGAALVEPGSVDPLLRTSAIEPWRAIGLSLALVALLAFIAFGYRCYRTDCLSKLQS